MEGLVSLGVLRGTLGLHPTVYVDPRVEWLCVAYGGDGGSGVLWVLAFARDAIRARGGACVEAPLTREVWRGLTPKVRGELAVLGIEG